MMAHEAVIAKRYAQAFINVYGDAITRDNYYAIGRLELFLKKHKELLFLFKLSHVADATKHQALGSLFQQVGLSDLFSPLATVLIADKRVFLLPEVLKYLSILYKERNKIMSYVITSSHPLSAPELEGIQKFLTHQTGYETIYETVVDPELIAGIRLNSDTFLWEYSIRRQLAHVGLPLIR